MSTEDDSDDSSDGDVPVRTTQRRSAGPRTRSTRTGANGVAGNSAPGDQGASEDDLYAATPRAQRTRAPTAGAETQSQSQSRFSPASSHPASQLLTSQDQDESEESESEDQAPPVSRERVRQFQTALGQLLDGPLFESDAAEAARVVEAVNAKVSQKFEDGEAKRVLEQLSEQNKIM